MSPRPKIAFDAGTLTLERIPREELTRVFGPIPWVWDARANVWRCDALHYTTAMELGGAGRIDVGRRGARLAGGRLGKAADPRPAAGATEGLGGLAVGRRGLVVMPTGTGKTEVALTAMAGRRGHAGRRRRCGT